MQLRRYDEAQECLLKSNKIARQDTTYLMLAKAYIAQNNNQKALDALQEALDFSPEKPELLTQVGLLYLRMGQNYKAFEYLGNSLTHNPLNSEAILAAGSIIQDHNDNDVALLKYRVAATQTPFSAYLWNNIGMAFFGKGNHQTAIVALKRALYLAPFEFIIHYNLGVAHLASGQYASAYHHLAAAVGLKPNFPQAFAQMGVVLGKLDDFPNACQAYERSLSLDKRSHSVHLNYAVLLYNQTGHDAQASAQIEAFWALYNSLDEEAKAADKEAASLATRLKGALGG